MVFNATFNDISVISWRSVLLVEETEVPGENHRPVASHCQILSHNVVNVHLALIEIRTHIRSRPQWPLKTDVSPVDSYISAQEKNIYCYLFIIHIDGYPQTNLYMFIIYLTAFKFKIGQYTKSIFIFSIDVSQYRGK